MHKTPLVDIQTAMNYHENDFPTVHSQRFAAKYSSRQLTLFIERALKVAMQCRGYAHFNYETTTLNGG